MKRLLVCAFVVTMLPGCPTFLANRPAASTEPEGMTIPAFVAQRPAEPVTLTAECTLGDVYIGPWFNATKTHYSVAMRQGFDLINGFVAMDSQVGREVFAALKDGKEHRLKVTLHLADEKGVPIADRSLNVCTITAVTTAR